MKSFLGRIVGFTIAMKDWVDAGRPLRDPEETRELFGMNCRQCPEFVPHAGIAGFAASGMPKDGGTCAECGCFVSDDPEIVFNRVNKPTLGCPLDKWRAIVDDEETP